MNNLKKVRMILLLLLFTLSSCIKLGELENTVVLEAGRYINKYPYDQPNSESTGSTLDLDSGAIGNLDEADIWFIGDGGSDDFYLIGNITGSLSKYMGFDEPDYEGCLTVIEELSESHIPDWREGGYICVLTNEGRISQVKTEDFYFEGPNVMLRVSFITWRKVIDRENE